jgi:hypothetical protein
MTGSNAGSRGSLITVGKGVTLTLKNITLVGLQNGQNGAGIDNNVSLIICKDDGKLILGDGAVITGNKTITGYPNGGGGIAMKGNSSLVMNDDSKVTGNLAVYGLGGGILLFDSSSLVMKGNSEISNNTSDRWGGGIHLYEAVTVSMSGYAKITGNTANGRGGGGICIYGGTFEMSGGTISKNNANELNNAQGGGVYIPTGTFNMSGGIIYGAEEAAGEDKNIAKEGKALCKGPDSVVNLFNDDSIIADGSYDYEEAGVWVGWNYTIQKP